MNILWSESGNMSFCQSLSTHFYDIPLIDLWWLAFARFETIRLQLGRQKKRLSRDFPPFSRERYIVSNFKGETLQRYIILSFSHSFSKNLVKQKTNISDNFAKAFNTFIKI